MFTKVIFDDSVSNSSVEEILREMPKYKDDLNDMCEMHGYHEVVHTIYQSQSNLGTHIDWERIEEILDEYLWEELIPEYVFAPVQEALSNLPVDAIDSTSETYCFNLGILAEQVQHIAKHFHDCSGAVEVYRQNEAIYAEFCASSEKEIDCCIEEACAILLFHYPNLDLTGASFEEKPQDDA